jgi:Domain of unknown function (DUF222)
LADRRGVSLSAGFDGARRQDGDLTAVAKETLGTALDALMAPPGPEENRTPRQRRHDALEDLARFYLDHHDTPQVGGDKPHINILCDLAALAGIAGGLHETETGQVLTVDQIRGQTNPTNLQLLCRYHHTLTHQMEETTDHRARSPG